MTANKIDPPPRHYPPAVSLLRRSSLASDIAGPLTAAEVETWLLSDALVLPDLMSLFQSFIWRIRAAALPLDRASLHVGTLHPQLFGYAWNWSAADGLMDEVKVEEATLKTDAYRRNPLYRVIEYGEVYRARTEASGTGEQAPLLAELAAQGITEYVAVPLRAGGKYHNAATVATASKHGFSDSEISTLRRLLALFALHVERHIAGKIAENALDTYLGGAAGKLVLDGAIKRGSGAPIDAVIWISDMRRFTDLAERLSSEEVTAVLNEYFGRLAGAVMAQGGDVLKFIGDGLLAVFPFANFDSENAAARAALAAARDALQSLQDLNDGAERLSEIEGWRPLRTGIALHRGAVFFGNVGSPRRLDFTVVGGAVNVASRVEGLCKTLGRNFLLTEQVASLLDEEFENLGAHHLQGFAQPITVFAPPETSLL